MIVYFDLDGTLLNSTQCSVVSAQETFKRFLNIDIPAEKIIEKMGIPIEVSFRELSNGQINDDNWDEVATFFRNTYKDNTDIYTSLYDGVDDLLQGLNAAKYELFIVTSKKTSAAEHNLKQLSVLDYFQGIIGSDKVDHYKPHPDPIFQARKFASQTGKDEIMVGDADTDIIMGKSAGVKTCAVTWGAHSAERLSAATPDMIVNTMGELRLALMNFQTS